MNETILESRKSEVGKWPSPNLDSAFQIGISAFT